MLESKHLPEGRSGAVAPEFVNLHCSRCTDDSAAHDKKCSMSERMGSRGKFSTTREAGFPLSHDRTAFSLWPWLKSLPSLWKNPAPDRPGLFDSACMPAFE